MTIIDEQNPRETYVWEEPYNLKTIWRKYTPKFKEMWNELKNTLKEGGTEMKKYICENYGIKRHR